MPDPTPGPPLTILLEDAHLVVVSKPPGLLTQGRRGAEPTLEDRLRAYLAPEAPDRTFLGTVHRLDRPVSGVIAWAKTEKAARRLSEQFADRRTCKTYWAVVGRAGPDRVPLTAGLWEDWLTPVGDGGVARLAASPEGGSKRAVTEARIQAEGDLASIELRPRTGRTHQLRAQCAGRGWPIAGDAAYGSRHEPPAPGAIGLHARRLEFEHPMTGRRISVVAPPPPEWSGWVGALPFSS